MAMQKRKYAMRFFDNFLTTVLLKKALLG